jgi:hypothetical protein
MNEWVAECIFDVRMSETEWGGWVGDGMNDRVGLLAKSVGKMNSGLLIGNK